MYYPILRGRQNELLAIRELVSESLLSDKVCPIIEPVKLSPTLISTMEMCKNKNRPLVLIRNPKVGSFFSDAKNDKNGKYLIKLEEIQATDYIFRGLIIDSETPDFVKLWKYEGVDFSNVITICTNADNIKYYSYLQNEEVKVVIPYASSFRRIRKNRILLDDKFNKQEKNADYINEDDEFFSDDHLFFEDDGYIGFSDYSVIGEEYSESGFAPRAVAIHIVYFDEEKNLRVKHFVSDDTEDTKDTANKFYQAVVKLVEWNGTMGLKTKGIREFERICEEQLYPGLGVVKKLSLMHHLELMSQFFDGIVR